MYLNLTKLRRIPYDLHVLVTGRAQELYLMEFSPLIFARYRFKRIRAGLLTAPPALPKAHRVLGLSALFWPVGPFPPSGFVLFAQDRVFGPVQQALVFLA